jgi:hypothetical protein
MDVYCDRDGSDLQTLFAPHRTTPLAGFANQLRRELTPLIAR